MTASTATETAIETVLLIGSGSATDTPSVPVLRPIPVAARVQYADPASWTVAAAVENALAACGPDRRPTADDRIGMITVSGSGTLETMRSQAERVAAQGKISPIRFAGGNPAAMAGVPCLVFGFHGPSLVLSMPVAAGAEPADLLASTWLRTKRARFVVVAAHQAVAADTHRARALVLGYGVPAPGADRAIDLPDLLTSGLLTSGSLPQGPASE
jgi:3-oxoacyl-(acyl-carrier-protein) synthase